MKVIKRNGRSVNFNPSKITARIKAQCEGLNVKPDEMAIKIISQMADGMSTSAIDTLSIEIAASLVPTHPDYSKLASALSLNSIA